MFSSFFNNTTKNTANNKDKVLESTKSIYDKRIECLERMLQIQKDSKITDDEYVNISCIEGKYHEDAWRRLEYYQGQYRATYAACSNILKFT